MALQPRPAICERARAWVSLRLDDELSDFEDALLASHLRSCAHCREYDELVRGAVVALRSEPLERLEHPVAVPSRRRTILRPTSLARAAALVVAVAGLVTALSTQSAHRFLETPTPQIAPADNRDLIEARALRVLQLGALPQSSSQLGVRGAVLQRTRL